MKHVYGEDGYDKAYERDRAERDRSAARWAEDMSRAADISTNPRETEAVRMAAASLAQEMAQHAAWHEANELAPHVSNMATLEYPPEQCDRCGEPLKHGGNDGHRCPRGVIPPDSTALPSGEWFAKQTAAYKKGVEEAASDLTTHYEGDLLEAYDLGRAKGRAGMAD